MYISRWILRGVALAVVAILVPTIVRPIINPDNLNTSDPSYDIMPSVVMLLVSVIFAVLALGQLQYAYGLYRLYQLLDQVANGRAFFRLTVDADTIASVWLKDNTYRIEVIDKKSEDLLILVVMKTMIQASRLSNVLTVVPANSSSHFHQVTFDEEPYSPDYRKQMSQLRWALLDSLPDKGRFTP